MFLDHKKSQIGVGGGFQFNNSIEAFVKLK